MRNTPLTALEMGRLALEVGFPPGVLNVVTGPGGDVGQAIAAHRGIAMVSLTGDTSTGEKIMAAAAPTVKRLHLELGGKAPFIVFDDADLQAAVQGAVVGGYVNTGQDCTAATRVNVQRPALRGVPRGLHRGGPEHPAPGPPTDPTSDMGPLISRDQRQKVVGVVERARQEGVVIATGGAAVDGPGFFYEPTVLVGAEHCDEVMQREKIRRVVSVIPFETEEEFLRLANGVDYGSRPPRSGPATLSGAAAGQGARVRRGLQFNHHLPLASEMPHGGVKRSGFGNDLSRYSFEEDTTVKHVMADLSGDVRKGWHFTAVGDAD